MRERQLNAATVNKGKCVLYVMGRDQRVAGNHALLAAQRLALQHKLPLAVLFCLSSKVGFRSREAYEFMLGGLERLETELIEKNIPLITLVGTHSEVLMSAMGRFEPLAVFFDFSPLRGPRQLAKTVADASDFPVYVVDTHNIVPVWTVTNKQEVGARTLRPRLHRLLADFAAEPEPLIRHPYAWPGTVMNLSDLAPHIADILDARPRSHVAQLPLMTTEALLQRTRERIPHYAANRNEPSKAATSGLSPYLHFGHISSLQVLLSTYEAFDPASEELAPFVEELVVRKELSDNFCYYQPAYQLLEAAPLWAQKSLFEHRQDPREHLYSLEELEHARTHDPAWNAAQNQLRRTGFMHGYMRMYWAKKVLEWSPPTPRAEGVQSSHPFAPRLQKALSSVAHAEWALLVLQYLNDFYSYDGGDPNGYTGILWAVGGVHDRPWGRRSVFGTIRYMNYAGLRRKLDIAAYEQRWL